MDLSATAETTLDFLLTMSPSIGINNLHISFLQALQIPPNVGLHSSEESMLERLRHEWSGEKTAGGTGTTFWATPRVEWPLVTIILRLQQTPTNLGPGQAVYDIPSAYIPIVRELVSQYSKLEEILD